MTDTGIRAMVKRRGTPGRDPERPPTPLPPPFADQWLAAGGSTDDLMHITGWKTYDMPLLYARGRGIERAREAHERLSPGDRL